MTTSVNDKIVVIDLTPDEKELVITALLIFEIERNLGKEDYAKVQTIKRKLETV